MSLIGWTSLPVDEGHALLLMNIFRRAACMATPKADDPYTRGIDEAHARHVFYAYVGLTSTGYYYPGHSGQPPKRLCQHRQRDPDFQYLCMHAFRSRGEARAVEYAVKRIMLRQGLPVLDSVPAAA